MISFQKLLSKINQAIRESILSAHEIESSLLFIIVTIMIFLLLLLLNL